jgi:hypothetical protein
MTCLVATWLSPDLSSGIGLAARIGQWYVPVKCRIDELFTINSRVKTISGAGEVAAAARDACLGVACGHTRAHLIRAILEI